ncbi:hypothetical protein IscW_ISCW009035 [Ixodes scapularis]|uniref:Uncharacterized protein n=2 Tax=Ixodes scapularis TaxID=6945 RepID=B7PZ46_IXOSC|nr:hypothetical protein IscW_ISCW009035 [Ixodes scapularis]|eukprot:XP_002404713.1 hypothetical protein IscW_ISCW009035 [Ixodes scapularis]
MVISIDYDAIDLARLSTVVNGLSVQTPFVRKVSGVEVRNVPLNLSDYDLINNALTKVKQDVSVISEVFIAFKPQYPWMPSRQMHVDIPTLTSIME